MQTLITRADIESAALAAAAASGTTDHLDALQHVATLIRARRAQLAPERDAAFARLAATARPDFMEHFGSARLLTPAR